MRELTLEELRKYQLDILDAVDAFCREQGITYWLDKGTLLGAVRHGGYIPWDDDIDIGMMREDYERFRATFNGYRDRYRFCSVESDPEWFMPYGKVLDRETVLIEDGRYTLAVNIDVDVYDSAPDDETTVSRMFDRRDRLRRLAALQTEDMRAVPPGLVKAIKAVRQWWLRRRPTGYYQKQMVANAKRYAGLSTERVANFLEYGRCVVPRDTFAVTETAAFEDRQYAIPARYDDLLTAYYGDYRTLPPEDKRVTHHRFVAYRKTAEDET